MLKWLLSNLFTLIYYWVSGVVLVVSALFVYDTIYRNFNDPSDYEKAVYYCGGKDNIRYYYSGFLLGTQVRCANGNSIDDAGDIIIPPKDFRDIARLTEGK